MRDMTDAAWAFGAYEAVRQRLPRAGFSGEPQEAPDLAALACAYDAFLLDSFGVLNIGETAIPGAVERMRQLRARGKRLIVVTNAAGYPKRLAMARYHRLGFDFTEDEVVSSRDTLLAHLADRPPRHWGLIASTRFGREEIEALDADFLGEDPETYDRAQGFLFLGASEWTEQRQALLEASLRRNPRPVLVGNPDIVAPTEDGLSREPGHFAHRLADATGVEPEFFGKPFPAIFAMALGKLQDIPRERIAMVGDTLHTDILGGAAAGLGTVLVTDHGSLKGENIDAAIGTAGIVPRHIVATP